MSLRFVALSAWKDLRRRAADPLALVLWLGIPLLVGGLLALVGSGAGGGARGLVLLADEDGSWAGRAIDASLSQGALGSLFDVTRVAAPEGRARLEASEATALVIVPAGATEALLNEQPLALTLVTNPAQRILPSIVEESLDLLVEASFYAQRLFATPVREFRARRQPGSDDFPSTAEVTALAAALGDTVRGLRPLLFPPVLDFPLAAPLADEGAGSPGIAEFGRLFLPGLLFMSLLFIAQGISVDVWEERTQGTLRRALSAPPGLVPFLAGKVLAGAVLAAAISIVGLAVAVALFSVPAGRALLALPWCTFGGTVLVALFLAPQAMAGSQRGANVLGTMLVFPLMMIGGSFFPFEAMPAWMAAVGKWTPNGQAVARLKEILDGTASAAPLLVAAIAMLIPAVAAVAFATVRLGRRFAGEA